MRIPSESNEFPNDNPALHQGASWICLDPLAAPRLVARPAVIAKATAAPARVAPPAPSAVAVPVPSVVAVRSTLLPPPSSPAEAAAFAETDEFVARFLARVSLPPAPRVPADAPSPELAPSAVEERGQRVEAPSVRMAPIAQFMLDELPSYKVRRAAASVPPPPAHVYADLPATLVPASLGTSESDSSLLRLDPLAMDVDSPLALVESLLPPALDELGVVASAPPMELAWRPESLWSVLAPVPHAYRALGWDSTAPKPRVHPELAERSAPAEVAAAEEVVASEVMEITDEYSASGEDPVIEVVQLMEVAPTPEAPAVEDAAAVPAAITSAPAVASVAQPTSSEEASVYETFVGALSAVLLQRGATRGAAVVGSLLEGERVDVDALGETLVQQLSSAGIGEQRGEQFLVDTGFAQTATGWKSLLSAESEDFSSCAETLDDWATRVVAALLPNAAPAKEIRKELRRKGVAAFGMLAAA